MVPCPVLTVAFLPAYRFLRRQVRWWYPHLFNNFPLFVVMHAVKGFGVVNKAEIDVFLELSCFFDDPMDDGNLISGSSALDSDFFFFNVQTGTSLVAQCLKNLPCNSEDTGSIRDQGTNILACVSE